MELKALLNSANFISIVADLILEEMKGGAGSGSWDGPGQPRFAWEGEAYHGTSPQNAEKIVQEGLKPRAFKEVYASGKFSLAAAYAYQQTLLDPDIKELAIVVVDKAAFKKEEQDTILEKKGGIPADRIRRVEIYSVSDLKKYNDAVRSYVDAEKLERPTPIRVVEGKAKKEIEDVVYCVCIPARKEKQLIQIITKSLSIVQKQNWERRWRTMTRKAEAEYSKTLSGLFKGMEQDVLGGMEQDVLGGVTKGVKGGAGSGNFDHAGRPGEVGGSAPGEAGGGDNEDPTATHYAKRVDVEARVQAFATPMLKHTTETIAAFPKIATLLKEKPINTIEIFHALPKNVNRENGFTGMYSFISKKLTMYVSDMATTTPILKIGDPKQFSVAGDVQSGILHEIGHHIYNQFTDKDLGFRPIWEKHGGADPSRPAIGSWWQKNVSKYAARNMVEAFAECFTAYTHPNYKAGMLPKEIELAVASVCGNKKKFIGIQTILKANFNYRGYQFDNEAWQQRFAEEQGAFVKEMYDQVGTEVFDYLKYITKNPELEGAFDVENPNVEEFINDYSYKFAEEVMDVTTEDLQELFKQAMEGGESIRDITGRVKELFDGYSTARAELIARTETIRASNYAAIESYKQSGVVRAKEWLVTSDDRLCPLCQEMDGTVIELDDNFVDFEDEFTGGGETMTADYEAVGGPPLHPNCRCTLIPVVDERYLPGNEQETEEEEKRIGLGMILKGGQGSGNFGHQGRPGEVGGSSSGEGEARVPSREERWIKEGLNNGIARAFNFAKTSKSKKEMGYIIDRHGQVHQVEGKTNAVVFPQSLLWEAEHVVHTHPSNTPLSDADVFLLLKGLGQRSISAITPNGTCYLLEKGRSWEKKSGRDGILISKEAKNVWNSMLKAEIPALQLRYKKGEDAEKLTKEVLDKIIKKVAINYDLKYSVFKVKGAGKKEYRGFKVAASGEIVLDDSSLERIAAVIRGEMEWDDEETELDQEEKQIGIFTILKGGPGSGSWNGPGDPRFAHEGEEEKVPDRRYIVSGDSPDFKQKLKEMGDRNPNFDVNRTGYSFRYDQMLQQPEWFESQGTHVHLYEMSPQMYLMECSLLHMSSLEQQRAMIDEKLLASYIERAKQGSKMPMPYLDKANKEQEGRHRAVVAEALGLKKIPVLVITGKPVRGWPPEKQVGLSSIFKGGPGSGNFGHAGRPGEVGGSGEGGGEVAIQSPRDRYGKWMDARGITERDITSVFKDLDKSITVKIDIDAPSKRGAAYIEATFKEGRKEIGSLVFHVENKTMKLDLYELNRSQQGTGQAHAIMARLDQLAKKMGCESTTLEANISIGTYAWARLGFDYRYKSDLIEAKDQLRSWVAGIAENKSRLPLDFGLLNERISKIKTAKDMSEFTMPGFNFTKTGYGIDNKDVPRDMRMNAGKAFMLGQHQGWVGIRRLR